MKPSQAFLLVLGILIVSVSAHADTTLWKNARIYTANPAQPWAEALVVRDQRVLAIGDEAKVRQAVDAMDSEHDLQGRLVLPGLVDAHAHPGWIALGSNLLELPEAPDLSLIHI